MNSYQEIIELVHQDLTILDGNLKNILKNSENELTEKLDKLIFSKSKRIRSVLMFLFSRAILNSIPETTYKIASAVEMIHNASLIHDDIIDDSDTRRGDVTLNYEFCSDLAVVAGDFLLSLTLEELISVGNNEVLKIFAKSLTSLCEGEITQYFAKEKVISIENYLSKSEKKTAILFKAGLLSLDVLNGSKYKDSISKFATNFGIAFQIRDDLINIIEIDDTKPVFNDIKNGIYTAPILYYLKKEKELPDCSSSKLAKKLEKSGAIHQTQELIQKHITIAIDSLDFMEDNSYKQAIFKLCEHIAEVREIEYN